METKRFKILTLNVRQWSRDLNKKKPTYWKTRAGLIKKLIIRENPDIIMFQELTFPMTCFVLPKGYKRATCCSISHHIYCRKEYKVRNREWHLHWCRALIDINNGSKWENYPCLNIYSVHSHWDRKIYLKVADQLVKSPRKSPTFNIAGGDWNVEPDVMLSRLRPLYLKTTHECTFQNWTNPESFGELDYFAYNHCRPTSVYRLGDFVSDHYPVILEL